MDGEEKSTEERRTEKDTLSGALLFLRVSGSIGDKKGQRGIKGDKKRETPGV